MTISVLHTFPNQSRTSPIVKSDGAWLKLKDGRVLLDLTAGGTGFAVLGGGNKDVITAINEQVKKYPHSDYKYFDEPIREELARILLLGSPGGLDRVFFSGGSGSEACEMALQLSYQAHCEESRPKKSWAIATRQSYHGSTTGALALGERPNLEFYSPMLPQNRLRIPECNYLKHGVEGESADEYGIRAASYLEQAIISIGAERVGCFLAETMLGGLVGDVVAPKTYWPEVRSICSRYNIHLILDEVWCGGGVTGKAYCFQWEDVNPDLVVIGKSLAAGYIPLSAVLTNNKFETLFKDGSGRIETSCTFQGHSTACAAAIAAQSILLEPKQLVQTEKIGAIVRDILGNELQKFEFIIDIRGRGIRNSIEYNVEEPNIFGQHIASILNQEENILVSGKWHRLSLTHSVLIDQEELIEGLRAVTRVIKNTHSLWTAKYRKNIKKRDFY